MLTQSLCIPSKTWQFQFLRDTSQFLCDRLHKFFKTYFMQRCAEETTWTQLLWTIAVKGRWNALCKSFPTCQGGWDWKEKYLGGRTWSWMPLCVWIISTHWPGTPAGRGWLGLDEVILSFVHEIIPIRHADSQLLTKESLESTVNGVQRLSLVIHWQVQPPKIAHIEKGKSSAKRHQHWKESIGHLIWRFISWWQSYVQGEVFIGPWHETSSCCWFNFHCRVYQGRAVRYGEPGWTINQVGEVKWGDRIRARRFGTSWRWPTHDMMSWSREKAKYHTLLNLRRSIYNSLGHCCLAVLHVYRSLMTREMNTANLIVVQFWQSAWQWATNEFKLIHLASMSTADCGPSQGSCESW